MRPLQLVYLWSGIPVLLGLGLVPSAALAWLDGDGTALVLFGLAAGSIALGLLARIAGRSPDRLFPGEGEMVVVLAWVTATLLGGLPYLCTGALHDLTRALFESLSGFTATGSTVLVDVEAVPRSLLLWRASTHWIGGLGIIVMVLALLPETAGSRVLFGAEAPVSLEERILPRMGQVVRSYLYVYTLLTLVEIPLLWAGPMDLFEAVCHAFAAIAGGGFSTRSLGIGAFDDPYTEMVLIFFMMAGAVSFFLHFRAILKRQPRVYLANGEVRVFVGFVVAASAVCAAALVLQQQVAVVKALRGAVFNVVSIITTTGFASEDFEVWPSVAQLTLILLMFVGGCSASTSGSIKCVRYQVAAKVLRNHVRRLLHPKVVDSVHVGRRSLPPETVSAVMAYMLAYLTLAAAATWLVALSGSDLVTSATAVAATLGNVGPGLGAVGPLDSFANLPPLAHWTLMVCMLAGRLEIFTLAALFLPEVWRYRRDGQDAASISLPAQHS